MPEPRLTASQRQEVVRRARGCCEYCYAQERFSPDPFSVEHILPIAKGGSSQPENLAFSRQGCNGRKYVSTEAIDPATGEQVPLYHPRWDRWGEHFAWNEDYTLIIGLTPIGRATVEKLHLNRVGLVNLRRVLVGVQEHPPEV